MAQGTLLDNLLTTYMGKESKKGWLGTSLVVQ